MDNLEISGGNPLTLPHGEFPDDDEVPPHITFQNGVLDIGVVPATRDGAAPSPPISAEPIGANLEGDGRPENAPHFVDIPSDNLEPVLDATTFYWNIPHPGDFQIQVIHCGLVKDDTLMFIATKNRVWEISDSHDHHVRSQGSLHCPRPSQWTW